jgi:hypothetical protein
VFSLGDKVAKIKPVIPDHRSPLLAWDGFHEIWPVVDERVEFAVLSAGVDGGREVREEFLVVYSAGKGSIEGM